jgi:hypothetical protein
VRIATVHFGADHERRVLKAERICASRSGSGASQSKPCSPSMKRRRMARRRTALISRS